MTRGLGIARGESSSRSTHSGATTRARHGLASYTIPAYNSKAARHRTSPRTSPRADPLWGPSPNSPLLSPRADGGYSSVNTSSHPPTSDEELPEEGDAMPSGAAPRLRHHRAASSRGSDSEHDHLETTVEVE